MPGLWGEVCGGSEGNVGERSDLAAVEREYGFQQDVDIGTVQYIT